MPSSCPSGPTMCPLTPLMASEEPVPCGRQPAISTFSFPAQPSHGRHGGKWGSPNPPLGLIGASCQESVPQPAMLREHQPTRTKQVGMQQEFSEPLLDTQAHASKKGMGKTAYVEYPLRWETPVWALPQHRELLLCFCFHSSPADLDNAARRVASILVSTTGVWPEERAQERGVGGCSRPGGKFEGSHLEPAGGWVLHKALITGQ